MSRTAAYALPIAIYPATLLSLCALATAQDYRGIDRPLFLRACYDPAREVIVAPAFDSYSREWGAGGWRRAPDLGAPEAPHMVWFDALAGHSFALALDQSGQVTTIRVLARHGSTWEAVPTSTAPSAGILEAACYDAARGELVLFGGEFWPQTAETWTFDGTTWTLRTPANSPSPRGGSAIAYDSTRQRVVLTGGHDSSGPLADTWEWDGTDWQQIITPTSPLAGTREGMAFDAARGRCVLLRHNGTANEHWEYDGIDWSLRAATPTAIDDQRGIQPVYHAALGLTVMLGGYGSDTYPDQVWAFDGSTWLLHSQLGEQPFWTSYAAAALAPGGNDVLVFGGLLLGNSPSDALWGYDGSTWTRRGNGGIAPLAASMWSTATDTFVFGGHDLNLQLQPGTWRWNGTSMQQVLVASPPARAYASLTYDAVHDRAVLFGGSRLDGVLFADTWTFDGVSWTQQLTLGGPSERSGAAIAYDPVRDRVVLFGGADNLQTLSDTWEWDGSAWQQVFTAQQPQLLGRMTYDAANARCVLAGADQQTQRDELRLWAYDGSAWTPLAADGTIGGDGARAAFWPTPMTLTNGDVVVHDAYGMSKLVEPSARVQAYGASCGPDPIALGANMLPQPGSAAFAIELTEAAGNSIVALTAGTSQVAVPVGGCTLLAPLEVVVAMLASANGAAQVALPIPALPSLLGAELFFQGAHVSAATPLGLELSRGLRVRIGD